MPHHGTSTEGRDFSRYAVPESWNGAYVMVKYRKLLFHLRFQKLPMALALDVERAF